MDLCACSSRENRSVIESNSLLAYHANGATTDILTEKKQRHDYFQMSCELNTGGGGPGSSRSSSGIQIGSAWFQRRINLRPQHRGVHLVTEEVLRLIPEISQFSVGLAHFQSISDKTLLFVRLLITFICSSPHIRQFSSQRKLGS